jgi:hypothetical protein
MNTHVKLGGFHKDLAAAFYRTTKAPNITYNKTFTKPMTFYKVIPWSDKRSKTGGWAGMYRVYASWDGRRFRQDFVYLLTREGLTEVKRFKIEYL